MEYEIISAKTPITVAKNVATLTLSGWVPCGGVTCGNNVWAQAVMRDPGMKHWFEMEQAAARARGNGTPGE